MSCCGNCRQSKIFLRFRRKPWPERRRRLPPTLDTVQIIDSLYSVTIHYLLILNDRDALKDIVWNGFFWIVLVCIPSDGGHINCSTRANGVHTNFAFLALRTGFAACWSLIATVSEIHADNDQILKLRVKVLHAVENVQIRSASVCSVHC